MFSLLRQLFTRKQPIVTAAQFEEFLSVESAKIAGNSVMKYAQKRLGKLHYQLSKDPNYCKELIGCQIKLHADVLSDLGTIVVKLFGIDNIDNCKAFEEMIVTIHRNYVSTSPEEFNLSEQLNTTHFAKQDMALKELAGDTGNKLFKLLPMTDNLIASDVRIFQGQIRLAYVDFLTRLSKRYNKTALSSTLFISNSNNSNNKEDK